MTVHGGDVWQLGMPAGDVLDFSANVNPRGLPSSALARLSSDAGNAQFLRRYPDRSACALRAVLSRQLDLPAEAIVIGAGAEALMSPALRSIGARRALVPIPAFSEYRRVCAQQDVEFVPFPLARSESYRIPVERLCRTIAAGQFDAVFVNNPHNPTGALLEAGETRAIAAGGVPLLLDEAFIDYAAHASLTSDAAERQGLIVLRSLTKFYGCPALRVGYAVAHPDTAREISALLPTWGVTQLALDALAVALEDREYAEASLAENAVRRESLRRPLEALGFTVFDSAANYLLLELPVGKRADDLRGRLLTRHGILIRNCDSYEGLEPGRFVRVAVLSEAANGRLIDALSSELKQS